MSNERFCQNTSLSSKGTEKFLQLPVFPVVPCPVAQANPVAGRDAVSSDVFRIVTRPAGCGHEAVPPVLVQLDPGALASGAPRVLKSTPEEAVLSFDATVLLMKFTARASWRETPPPSQPATLLEMMLL